MNGPINSRRTLSAGVLAVLAGAGVAACDDAADEEYRTQQHQFQCAVTAADGSMQAVDCDDVDDDSGSYGGSAVFLYSMPINGTAPAHAPGARLPAGGARISYRDTAGRTRWGLPPSGRVANGTVKTNIVGKGGALAPAGAKAGG